MRREIKEITESELLDSEKILALEKVGIKAISEPAHWRTKSCYDDVIIVCYAYALG